MQTTNFKTETLIDARKEVGLKLDTEETRYISRHENAGQSQGVKIVTGTVQIFGNGSRKSKFDSGGSREEV
jgi:hypothetical protein